MADTHDTIDGLLAEFRGYSAGMPASYHVTMSWADFRRMLDRFEAAHKRERAKIEADALAVGGVVEAARKSELSKNAPKNASNFGQLGDAAKLREAIIKARSAICQFARHQCQSLSWENCNIQANCGDVLCSWRGLCGAKTAINAALSAPPRNVDLYATADEARKAYEEYRRDYIMRASNKFDFPMEFEAWLFATATKKEGGAK